MKVKELIEKLEQLDPEEEIYRLDDHLMAPVPVLEVWASVVGPIHYIR